jgi:hypothetical protein
VLDEDTFLNLSAVFCLHSRSKWSLYPHQLHVLFSFSSYCPVEVSIDSLLIALRYPPRIRFMAYVTTCAAFMDVDAATATLILMFVWSSCMKYLSTACISSVATDTASLHKMLDFQMYVSIFSFCMILWSFCSACSLSTVSQNAATNTLWTWSCVE